MAVQFECFSKACSGKTVIELSANQVVACPACGATYLFDGTETKRVDEQGKPLSDEAIERWEASQAGESDSGLHPADEKATALGEDGLPRRVAETPPVPTKKADLVAETSAATLELISTILFFNVSKSIADQIFIISSCLKKFSKVRLSNFIIFRFRTYSEQPVSYTLWDVLYYMGGMARGGY